MPIPAPHFKMMLTRVFSNGTAELLCTEESETGILSMCTSQLRSLFEEDTKNLTIMCNVWNEFGSDNMTTDIRMCGMLYSPYQVLIYYWTY